MKVTKNAKAKSRVSSSSQRNRVQVTRYNRDTWYAVHLGGGLYRLFSKFWGQPRDYWAESLMSIFGKTHRLVWELDGIKAVRVLAPKTIREEVARIYATWIWGDKPQAVECADRVLSKVARGKVVFSHTSTDNWGGVACAVRRFVIDSDGEEYAVVNDDGMAVVIDPTYAVGSQIRGEYRVI